MAALTDTDFHKFKDLVYKKSGVFFSEYNKSVLESRINRSLKKHQLENPEDLYKLLTQNAGKCTDFIDSITTNLTRFFRNDAHFKVLKNTVWPWLKKKNQHKKTIKIWSAGCSTGEEPYSLIISAFERIPEFKDWQFKILASDISLKVLMKAKQGFYPQSKLGQVPSPILEKYFTKMDEGYTVNSDIKKLIKFDYHNLMNDCSFSDFDMIFCRNVIIYFDEATQKKVTDKFYRVLSDPGILFLGHSESLFFMETNFRQTKTEDNVTFYTKGTAAF